MLQSISSEIMKVPLYLLCCQSSQTKSVSYLRARTDCGQQYQVSTANSALIPTDPMLESGFSTLRYLQTTHDTAHVAGELSARIDCQSFPSSVTQLSKREPYSGRPTTPRSLLSSTVDVRCAHRGHILCCAISTVLKSCGRVYCYGCNVHFPATWL
ncbi:hypothetical protein PsYK624_085460 [Phanerochaete sordida]|uniref:Uncharacterized protein n=1 Tax=Phanerochaete sordida TaxID=48140 RepID=A0A9P3GAV3_9APHY|nr:hypothetical protein PsYK624_085460 [Phanerochaete sordida]